MIVLGGGLQIGTTLEVSSKNGTVTTVVVRSQYNRICWFLVPSRSPSPTVRDYPGLWVLFPLFNLSFINIRHDTSNGNILVVTTNRQKFRVTLTPNQKYTAEKVCFWVWKSTTTIAPRCRCEEERVGGNFVCAPPFGRPSQSLRPIPVSSLGSIDEGYPYVGTGTGVIETRDWLDLVGSTEILIPLLGEVFFWPLCLIVERSEFCYPSTPSFLQDHLKVSLLKFLEKFNVYKMIIIIIIIKVDFHYFRSNKRGLSSLKI